MIDKAFHMPQVTCEVVGITDNKAKHGNCRSEAEINAAWDAQETTIGLGNNKLTSNMWLGKMQCGRPGFDPWVGKIS